MPSSRKLRQERRNGVNGSDHDRRIVAELIPVTEPDPPPTETLSRALGDKPTVVDVTGILKAAAGQTQATGGNGSRGHGRDARYRNNNGRGHASLPAR